MADIRKPNFATARGTMAIVELSEPFERLELQFVPQDVAWNRTATEASYAVVNRNNDVPQITGGNDTLAFSLDFYSDDNDVDDIKSKVLWLQSLSYAPVRKCKVLWGDFLGVESSETWILTSVSAKFAKFMPENGMRPQQANIDLVFKLAPDENRTVGGVRLN
jgi:hypothetical protein